MISILHLIDHFGVGGAQTNLREIIKFAPSSENHYLYILRSTKNEISINSDRIFRSLSCSRLSLAGLIEIKKIIIKYNIKIIHAHLFRSQVFAWIIKKIWFPHLVIIIHEHGNIFEEKLLTKVVFNLMRNSVDSFICNSNATKAKLIELTKIRDKITVIYNGIDLDYYDPSAIDKSKVSLLKQELNLLDSILTIGYVGRIDKEKGVDVLINSACSLDLPFKLIIIGEGSLKKKFENYCALKLKGKVAFLPFQQDVRPFYSLFDVIVVPSFYEALSKVIQESQALGIAIIASNIGGIPELISHKVNGILFEAGNVNQLTECLKTIGLNHELRSKLGCEASKSIQKFSWKKVSAELSLLYQSALSEK